jgi:hypothetical protein
MNRTISEADWRAEGAKRFGEDMMKWRFVCPSCGHVATVADWHAAGAPADAVAFSCVGRWIPSSIATIFEKGKGPCNYAGGGLFKINPVIVESGDVKHDIFEFAEAT